MRRLTEAQLLEGFLDHSTLLGPAVIEFDRDRPQAVIRQRAPSPVQDHILVTIDVDFEMLRKWRCEFVDEVV
jgi:hypothetical protein